MYKYFIILFCLISFIHSYYLPYKKNKNFPEDTCRYIGENNIYFVKDCDEGKYCNTREYSFSICEDIPTDIKLILENGEENCESDFQCETGLECVNKKCIKDCLPGETSVRTEDGYICIDRDHVGIFYKKDFTWTAVTGIPHGGYIAGSASFYNNKPEHFKVYGKITMHTTTDNDGKIYEPEKIEHTDIGSLEDGELVYDEKACSSGFALYFYGDGTLIKPYKYDTYNFMYKKCVTLEEIELLDGGNCKIKYKIGENGNILNYNINMLDNKETCYKDPYNQYLHTDHYYNNPDTKCHVNIRKSDLCSSNLKIKLKMFKNYISALNNDNKKCTEPEKTNNKLETCKDNTLRYWSYFYENPEDYVLYYDEEKASTVVNYLLQTTFPSYQFSEFLNIKYFISLLLLLYL